MFVCSCFGVTEEQVREHAEAGACTPRQIASLSKAGTDCGSCVRRIQGLLGRGGCSRRAVLQDAGPSAAETAEQPVGRAGTSEPESAGCAPAPSPAPEVADPPRLPVAV
ncbi:bacterioferritin-associated ferredoxin [Streptomyces sp. AJS327]|uniref:(2Fe-2S)-binding protein n=1 Tax=Streptomyces sp. AJS327 TaxID=2545265 RepID=UPI0015DEF41B|nr:(2Fe-2S)-binding protein [Streptomyces sp. AJS327]